MESGTTINRGNENSSDPVFGPFSCFLRVLTVAKDNRKWQGNVSRETPL